MDLKEMLASERRDRAFHGTWEALLHSAQALELVGKGNPEEAVEHIHAMRLWMTVADGTKMFPTDGTHVVKQWRDFLGDGGVLTQEDANKIRHLRVDLDCTLRAVAGHCSDGMETSQCLGLRLCEAAAAMFGEDASVDPW